MDPYTLSNRLVMGMKKYTNNNVYEFLSEEINVAQVMQSMTADELRAKESDTDFWEELSEHLDCFRICDACHKPMIEGYCIDDGAEHYCSSECLHTQMTDEEFAELCDGEEGTSYFTNWYEDSITYKNNNLLQ